MRGWWRWTVGHGMASALYAANAAAQAPAAGADPWSNVCALATSTEFQQVYGIDPRIGILPDDPTPTEMVWGPHCDYADGSIDLFTKQSPGKELERVLGLMKAEKRRDPVEGLGQRAFFTAIYPDDQYRRRGLLAVFLGPRIVTFSMDGRDGEPLDATRPKLERLARLVLPRLE